MTLSYSQMDLTTQNSSCLAESHSYFSDFPHLVGNLRPVNFVVQIPLIKEVEQYPRFMDPRDPNCLDKA